MGMGTEHVQAGIQISQCHGDREQGHQHMHSATGMGTKDIIKCMVP